MSENVSGKALAAGSSGETGNAESQRTQSSSPHIFSALSASPRFKTSPTEIAEHGHVLTPGRYVGAEEVKDDGIPFAEKTMHRALFGNAVALRTQSS